MKNYFAIALLCITASLTSCGTKSEEVVIAEAKLTSTADNKEMGTAKFYQQENGNIAMELEITYTARADSSVAVHFHEHGDCGNMGENTHGHWNPTKEAHGKWGSDAYHSGDIGNIQLDSKGHAVFVLMSDRWSIKDGDIKNIIGRGIIVHGGVDDYTTQPTGNSGPRIGCGVIEKK
ncbi:superoxide dismutase family protein [Pedobacter metabolipauper]|uniref:Superoxide dismutase [Cu-Zn] n=1 Tax=Pedobacter metabolipauper TaxID=425513 RepID=A0A4R6SZE9_9SPHI|nr:superoxide dismutase family protein [Pedobacter metabolipauper]TDQ11452.1 Cu-Zn family superoxide dismutase [Pedobacter metabolipauper]